MIWDGKSKWKGVEMKLIVFSDIHGNDLALEAFMKKKDEFEYDKIIFLGDVFGYYYNQNKCIELLKEIPDLIWLKGNHDEYAVKSYFCGLGEEVLISSYGHSYEHLRERFDKNDMKFFSELKSSYVIKIDDRTIGFYHGRPADSLEGRIYSDTELNPDEFAGFDIVLFGHTHCKIDRKIGKTRILSPGSLGQPRDGKGYGFLVVDTVTNECLHENVHVNNFILKNAIDKKDSELNKLYDVLSRETDDKFFKR